MILFLVIYEAIWFIMWRETRAGAVVVVILVVQGVAVVATVNTVIVVSFMESSVRKKNLCLFCMLFLIYCNRRLKFINKGFKII